MFKKEVYTMIAKEFGTPIGVVQVSYVENNSINREHTQLPDISTKDERAKFKNVNEEYRINRIVQESIKKRKYKLLTRGVFWAKRVYPKWSERRAYSYVWNLLNTPKGKRNVDDKGIVDSIMNSYYNNSSSNNKKTAVKRLSSTTTKIKTVKTIKNKLKWEL